VGLLLVSSSLLKAYDISYGEVAADAFYSQRWFVILLVWFELGLGICLVFSLVPGVVKWVAVATFLIFLEFALYMTVRGDSTCPCLGRVAVTPWLAVLLDLLSLGLLLVWNPRLTAIRNGPGILLRALTTYGFIVLLLTPNMVSFIALSPIKSLRRDNRLSKRIDTNLKDACVAEVLPLVGKAAGLSLTLAHEEDGQASIGEVRTSRVRLFSLMELVVEKLHQANSPTRWEPIEGGYRLARATPLGEKLPWALALMVLLGGIISTRFSGGRKPMTAGSPQREAPPPTYA